MFKKEEILQSLAEGVKNYSREILPVILGPTATGKTDLSLEIAEKIGGEIISADSRQVYQEITIASNALSPKKQKGIPHHLLEFLKPDEVLSLRGYVDLAWQKIKEIHERGKIPVLVGGTGLYISALIDGYDLPYIPPNPLLRKEMEELAKISGKEAVFEKLRTLAPEVADKIDANNLRYVVRALEKILFKGTPEMTLISSKKPVLKPFLVGISWPREIIYRRIEKRVDEQIERGLLEEVKSLIAKGYAENLPAMTALGVKQIIPFARGTMSLAKAMEILKRDTRHYAKRQITWFKRYEEARMPEIGALKIHWLNPATAEKIMALT